MKASQVCSKYSAGERNFQRQNLRGESFTGQDLSGVDFSGSDIRSTNFSNAILENANFSGVKAGQQKRWLIILLLALWCISFLLGLVIIAAGTWMVTILVNLNNYSVFASLSVPLMLLTIVAFYRISIISNFLYGLIIITIPILLLFIVAAFADRLTLALYVGIILSIVIVAIASIIISWIIISSLFLTEFKHGLARKKGIIVSYCGILWGIMMGISHNAGLGAIEASFEVGKVVNPIYVKDHLWLKILACTIASLIVHLSHWIAGYILPDESKRDLWIKQAAKFFATIKGTDFTRANLTQAKFERAILKGTNFYQAIITRIYWDMAQKLNRVRTEHNTYLNNAQLIPWLIGTVENKNNNFNCQDLQGVNFKRTDDPSAIQTDLSKASFIDADLRGACLQNVNLKDSILVQANLDDARLQNAELSGATIQEWNITKKTQLDDVVCSHIFLKLPTEEHSHPFRKPDNWNDNFQDGDFADFIQPVFDTLDLYHNQGVDPRAIAISWRQLAENYPDANLQFASIEVKSQDNLLLRFKTAPNASLSQLNAEYFDLYNYFKSLSPRESEQLLVEKDDEIRILESFVKTALPNKSMKTIKIFLASSSELESDRREFEIFINRKNKEYIKHNLFLELLLWEDFIDAMSATRLQDEYNKAVRSCDIFVSLFHTKVGKYTEEEFLKALETFNKNGKPLIYTYFNQTKVEITPQIISLLNFQQKLSDLGHFYTKYDNVDDLKFRFSEQLVKVLPQLTGVDPIVRGK